MAAATAPRRRSRNRRTSRNEPGGAVMAGAQLEVVCDQSRVIALLCRIDRMNDPALHRAAFIAYDALVSIGQAFETDTIGPWHGCMTVVVHPSPALRRIVDGLERASRADE